MYYEVTITYRKTNRTTTLKIDKNEIWQFFELALEHVSDLCSFSVTRYTIHEEV